MISPTVRGRFAPTPSGYLHVGNALTALLAWLQVRQQNGTFILRIEDLDDKRLHPKYIAALFEDLHWLGIDWDEGPESGGPFSPYHQKDRTHLYHAAFEELKNRGLLYPCFCSRKQLRAFAVAPHGVTSEGPAYSGKCRYLSEEERLRKATDKTPSWRFILPDTPMAFDDLVYGKQTFAAGAGGDFVVCRADEVFGYQLAVVIDDAAMGVTHVLRGNDLLDSTPRQLCLYQALGLTPPSFAHVPLIYASNGERLAKRNGQMPLRSMRKEGLRPQHLIGYLAWLTGLLVKPEPIELLELIKEFDVRKIVRHRIVLPVNWSETLMKSG